jgi:hypothetical protein
MIDRRVGVVAITLFMLMTVAARYGWASDRIMPDRDALNGVAVVIWGTTTEADGTAYSLDFGDGSPALAGVVNGASQSYIAATHTYTTALQAEEFTATLTIGGNAPVAAKIAVFNSGAGSWSQLQWEDVANNVAIHDGLRYLYWATDSREARHDAGWPEATWSGHIAYTSMAALAFENHGYTPASGGIYGTLVQAGLNGVFDRLVAQPLGVQPAGDPCVPGVLPAGTLCQGLLANVIPGYATGAALLAIAGSGTPGGVVTSGPATGQTYLEVAQRLVNTIAWGQADSGYGQGGWRYTPNIDSDGSAIGWNVLGLIDAQAFGATIPAAPTYLDLRGELEKEIASLTGHPATNAQALGSLGYTAPLAGTPRAGIRLQALQLVGGIALAGLPPTAPAVTPQDTVDYINSNWNNDGTNCYYNAEFNKGCLYAMFNTFKGLKLYGVNTLPAVARADQDWHRDYQAYLVGRQVAPGSSTGGSWANETFSSTGQQTIGETALALLILSDSATILPDEIVFDLANQAVLIGDMAHLSATAQTQGGGAVPGVDVTFEVVAGPHTGLMLTDTTDESGVASASYANSNGPGIDEIVASVGSVVSNSAFVDWISTNTPPDASGAYPSIACVNLNEYAPFAMIPIEILGLSDPDGDPLTVQITGVTSDEPTQRNNGDPAPDADGLPTAVRVRHQSFGGGRDFGGNGRVYEISFTADDGSADPVASTVLVQVPHDNAPPDDPCGGVVDDGQIFDATAFNGG